MTRLTLQLLGSPTAKLQDGTPVEFRYDKVRALLAYLAVEHERAHPRARLAALLWPEASETSARHSLSQALSGLRQALGDRTLDPPLLLTSRESIRLDIAAGIEVDLLEWRQLILGVEKHDHPALSSCPECVRRLEHAVGLVRGPFLEGFSLPDSEEFEDWQRSVEQEVERSLESTLRRLVDVLEANGQPDRACRYAERLTQIDPWDEESQRAFIRLLARSGQRATALKQFDRYSKVLSRDLDATPEDETVELAERIRAGLEGPTSFEPPSVATRPPRMALPTPSTSFIGREEEVEQLSLLVDSGESRLITLTGAGGIGKTRLAIEIARARQSMFPDGVYFAPLTGLASPQLLASSILDAMSAQVDPQVDSRRQLLSYLEMRRTLLVLDNFEHLLSGTPLLSEILEYAPGVQIIVTSRERLALSAEWVYEVHGLSLPDGDDAPAIATSGAARLFMLCARKHNAGFLPRDEDTPAIARICHLTGGMPLAIELAAAWIPVLTPGEIVDEIRQSLDFLHTEMRDLPERHQSIRAVLDRSWENLTEVEQRTFRRLAVFRGGFTRAAASYVAGASLPILSSLVNKSFMHREQSGRYQIHELLRQYGESLLCEEPEEAEVVANRHRDYYIGFLAVREEQLEGRGQATALSEIADEIENVRAVWQRAIATADLYGMNRAAHSLWLFYETTGRYREGATAFEHAYRAIAEMDGIAEDRQLEYDLACTRLRTRQAALAFRITGPADFRMVANESIAVTRQLDEPEELGLQLNYFAVAAHVLGEWDEEERALTESIEQFERAGRRWGVAYSKNDLGHLRALQGHYREARSLHQEALEILEELGDRRGVAFALRNLGIVANKLGDTELALALLRRSIDIRRLIGHQWGIAESLNQVGVVLRDSGQTGAALEQFREALQIAREIRAMQLIGEILSACWPLIEDDQQRDDLTPSVQALIDHWSGSDTGQELAGSRDEGELTRVVEMVLSDAIEDRNSTASGLER